MSVIKKLVDSHCVHLSDLKQLLANQLGMSLLHSIINIVNYLLPQTNKIDAQAKVKDSFFFNSDQM